VDYNPTIISHMQKENIPFKYGDAEDIEFLRKLHLDKVKMVVSTIPDDKTSLLLLKKIRKANARAIVILLAHDIASAKELYEHGATYVIMPHYLSARHASDIIERHSFDVKEFEKEKEKHIAYIEKREGR
jgi:voltage-gated potassium channel